MIDRSSGSCRIRKVEVTKDYVATWFMRLRARRLEPGVWKISAVGLCQTDESPVKPPYWLPCHATQAGLTRKLH
jgi:hypothetical protein